MAVKFSSGYIWGGGPCLGEELLNGRQTSVVLRPTSSQVHRRGPLNPEHARRSRKVEPAFMVVLHPPSPPLPPSFLPLPQTGSSYTKGLANLYTPSQSQMHQHKHWEKMCEVITLNR